MASRHDGTDLRSSKAAALTELLELVPFLYHRLRAASQSLHGEGEFSGARRSVLRSLTLGPATVPALARQRPVVRQVMQRLVDDLARDGLVEFADNPAHQRSKLVQLTKAGQQRLQQMLGRERQSDGGLLAGLSAGELQGAADVLRTLINRFGKVDAAPARRRAKGRRAARFEVR